MRRLTGWNPQDLTLFSPAQHLVRCGAVAISAVLAIGCAGAGPAPATTSTATGAAEAASVYPTCSRGAADPARLMLALEIHVESRTLTTGEEVDYVLNIAQAAATAGVPLSFGLGQDLLRDFAGGATVLAPVAGPVTLDDLVATLQDTYCHAVTVHADVGENDSVETARALLSTLATEVDGAGGDGTVASGVCNEVSARGGWLRAAREAGIQTVVGAVEDCQASLDRAAYPLLWRDPRTCTPAKCHDHSPLSRPEQRAAGWFARYVSAWIDPYAPTTAAALAQSVFIVGSFGETNAPCMAEVAAGLACPATHTELAAGQADADVLMDELRDVVASYRSGTAGDAFHVAFSTNITTEPMWLRGFFGEIGNTLALGDTWSGTPLRDAVSVATLPDVGQANRAETGL